MRRAGVIVAAVALALPAVASAEQAQVDMFQTQFNPAKLTVVAGDTVTWRNGDIVVHDVKGSGFASGVVGRFESFSQRFDTPGTVAYLCSLHLGMGAQLEVLAAQLTAPAGTFYAGESVELRGRTAPGAAVTLERDSGGWQPAGTVTAGADGTFKAKVEAAAAFRARTAAGESPAVAATLKAAPKVGLKVVKGRLKVTTTPAATGLVARFEARKGGGWKPFATKKLDGAGRASVAGREGRLRVVLTRGKVALATSRTVKR